MAQFKKHSWACPICRLNDEKFLGFRGGRYHRYRQGIESRIVQCRRCSLIYSNPFPIPLDAETLYGDPKAYFENHNAEEKIHGNRAILKEVRTRIGREPRVLDVGSGCGELLVAARDLGIEAVGLEFSDSMIRYGADHLGVEIKKMSVEEAAQTWPGSFDAVVLNAVLEHVYDPDGMIRAVGRLLRNDGIVYIDVPNEPNLLTRVGNLTNRLLGNHGVYNLSPTWSPYHVYGFNHRSLSKLLMKHSLRIESYQIHADPRIPSAGSLSDRLKAAVASRINRFANLTRSAGNMSVWARRT